MDRNPEAMILPATLCFLMRLDRILLAKKLKSIGKGKWNGYGGRIERGESPKAAAARELWEETGGGWINDRKVGGIQADADDLHKVALIDFDNVKPDGGRFICRVHVYLALEWKGDIELTDEMGEYLWFELAALPLGQMMLADREWVPAMLRAVGIRKKLRAHACYGPEQQSLTEPVAIEYVDELP